MGRLFTKYKAYILLYLIFLLSVVLVKLYQITVVAQIVLLSPIIFTKDIKDLGYRNFKKGFIYGITSLPVFILFPPNLSCWAFVLNNLGVAVAEETFFRGFLMRRLNNLTVSLLFTLPHIILYQNVAAFLTFFPSLIFGWVYIRSGSILAPVIYHFVFNLAYFSVVEKFPILYRSVF